MRILVTHLTPAGERLVNRLRALVRVAYQRRRSILPWLRLTELPQTLLQLNICDLELNICYLVFVYHSTQ
jgi:hypothetical protein